MMDEQYIAEVEKELAEVAACLGNLDVEAYRSKAVSAARRLGSAGIGVVPQFYHYPNNPGKPEHAKDSFNGLGEWMELCQAAAFEVIFNFKEVGLPYLRAVAFGHYDWPQGFAVAALCRLAAEGIERKEIVADLQRELPAMREESHYRAASLLLPLVRQTPELRVILDCLDRGGFQDVVKELEAIED